MFENAQFINIGFNADVAYNDLPELPPAISLTPGGLETQTVLKSCIQARVALSELNQLCRHFPLPEMFWRIFPLIEAHASAEADGHTVLLEKILRLQQDGSSAHSLARSQPQSIQLSNGSIDSGRSMLDATIDTGMGSANLTSEKSFATSKNRHTDPAVNRVLLIRDALLKCFNLERDRLIDGSLLLELCCDLQQKPVSIRRSEGEGIVEETTKKKIYQPPEGAETLQHLLLNWERFTNVDAGNLDPLVLMAVAHYQLSSIEPFPECSETLTRLVDQLLITEEALLNFPVLNLSAWFHSNQIETNELKLKVTQEQDWHAWIMHFIKGIHSATEDAIAKINTVRDLIEQTDRYVKQVLPKVYSSELIEALFVEPCTRIYSLVDRDIAKRQTASVYLKQLCEADVLKEVPYGKEKLFVNHRLLKLLCNQSDHFESYPK